MKNVFENGFDFSDYKLFFKEEGECEIFDVESAKRSDFTAYYVNARATKALKSELAAEIYVKAESRPFVAIYSYCQWWMRPEFGNDFSKIPHNTAALILDNLDGTFTYIMCGVGSEYKTYITGTEDGFKLCLFAQYPLDSIDMQLAFITATGSNVSELATKGAAEMCKFMGNGLKVREERRMPDLFEYIGWCSWDAFHIFVNHDGLVEKAREFASKGVPIGYAIIDDMWANVPKLKPIPEDMSLHDMVQIMHASPMKAFDGDPDKFPKGMAAAVADIKAAGIPNVGLWFPTTGYWFGLIEGEEAYSMQSGNTVKNVSGRIIASPEPEAARRFFDVFCKKALEFGCSFVKIDNQGYHVQYRELAPIGKSAAAIQKGIDSAAFDNFGGTLINCMGMPTECMYNRPDSAVARCSNDFSPENRTWFAKNIVECSYNGLLQGKFYINDWDMFWTDDAQAEKNAICHAISGGPVYISDKIGRTNPEVLSPLIFDDGRILRLSESAIPTEDSIIGDPRENRKIFKLRNSFDGGATVAVFNIFNENTSVKGTVSASDAGLCADKSYAYYEYFTGDFGYVNGDELLDVELSDNDEMRYYTFIEKNNKQPLFIGRIDKYNPRIAVISQNENEVKLYEGGDFAFFSDEDYAVYDEDGNEIECDRYGIMVTGTLPRDKKTLRFELI